MGFDQFKSLFFQSRQFTLVAIDLLVDLPQLMLKRLFFHSRGSVQFQGQCLDFDPK